MADLDGLPYFKQGTTVHQASSFDRGGGADDGTGYFLYYNYDTKGFVVMEEYGPGTIHRIWVTDQFSWDPGNIRVYFDGETKPRVDMPIDTFFSGATRPFLFPLVGNDKVSNGGFYCYYPLSFRQSVRVEFTKVPRYYNITYHLYNSADGVATYTGSEGLSAVYEAWENPPLDPKDATGNQIITLPSFDLQPGEVTTLLDLSGSGSMRSIRLRLPQLVTTQYPGNGRTVTDDGRAHRGNSTFTVATGAENEGVALIRRLNHDIADQAAEVYVDGQLVGTWADPGKDSVDKWRDSRFEIPSDSTRGKAQIVVKVVTSGSREWNEFYYWVKTRHSNGREVQTDSINVGNGSSESAHAYRVSGGIWSGSITDTYPRVVSTAYDAATLDILGKAIIQIYWDGEVVPSVNVPLGFLFGVGSSGEGLVNGLLMGTDPVNHTLYNYFPMPYNRSARIVLVNSSSRDIVGASAELQYNTRPYSGLGVEAGYFTAVYNRQTPTQNDRDYVLLDVPSGTGHVVGIVLNISNIVYSPNWGPMTVLEGDERVFIDSREFDPEVHGTGTEDLFNGGWYFGYPDTRLDWVFTLPPHGCSLFHQLDGSMRLAMYRLFLPDMFPFERRLTFNLEHGRQNEANADYESAVFAYLIRDREALVQTDHLQVGDAASRSVHNYSDSGYVREEAFGGTFVGRDDGGSFSGSGRTVQYVGNVTFTLSVSPQNEGVRIARILNHRSEGQKGKIYVDGQIATTWFTGGSNQLHTALYDYIELDPALTRGKSSIQLKIEYLASKLGWTQFEYYAYSHVYPLALTPTPSPSSTATPTSTPSKTATPTNTHTPTASPSATITPTPEVTETPSATPTATTSASPTASPTPTHTSTATVTPTRYVTPTPVSRCLSWTRVWQDEFDDPNLGQWQKDWGQGSGTMTGSTLSLRGEAPAGSFPLLWTNDLFPQGDYTLAIRFQFSAPTHYETSIAVGSGAYDGSRYPEGTQLPEDIANVLSVRQDAAEFRISTLGDLAWAGPVPDTRWHVVELAHEASTYVLRVDGRRVGQAPDGGAFATSLHLGSPLVMYYPGTWTALAVDYVRVQICQLTGIDRVWLPVVARTRTW